MKNNKKIKILIVEDSLVMRHFLETELSQFDDFNILGAACDAFEARKKIIENKPDIITLDINMPKIDGLTFLGQLMKHYPIPTIIVSATNSSSKDMKSMAIKAGAVDFVSKTNVSKRKEMISDLADKIRMASNKTIVKQSSGQTKQQERSKGIIAIGASTGGTVAITKMLMQLPKSCAPIVIVQHMPVGFTKTFAERLNERCLITVKEAKNGDRVMPGHALLAPGDYHMELRKNDSFYVVLNKGPKVKNQRPSVDVLFNSMAILEAANTIGVLLTGMGSDGARGLLNLRQSGALTIAQDEESSAVFGMPKRAIEMGAVCRIAQLHEIPDIIMKNFSLDSF